MRVPPERAALEILAAGTGVVLTLIPHHADDRSLSDDGSVAAAAIALDAALGDELSEADGVERGTAKVAFERS